MKTCPICKGMFEAKNRRKMYCGPKCAKKANWQQQKAAKKKAEEVRKVKPTRNKRKSPAVNPQHMQPHWQPTPEEIRAACEEIRKGWSKRERERQERKRAVGIRVIGRSCVDDSFVALEVA